MYIYVYIYIYIYIYMYVYKSALELPRILKSALCSEVDVVDTDVLGHWLMKM